MAIFDGFLTRYGQILYWSGQLLWVLLKFELRLFFEKNIILSQEVDMFLKFCDFLFILLNPGSVLVDDILNLAAIHGLKLRLLAIEVVSFILEGCLFL